MSTMVPVQLLRVYCGEATRHDGMPLYEALLKAARAHGMAGATVMRGFMGFGADSLLHTARILRLSEDLPVIVEIVDSPERMADFLPVAQAMVTKGTLVLEEARGAICPPPLRPDGED
ncbi:DUF190 domain-containing protein [Desulfovibrio sulfodismutans]|uniref:DUF190 domain-containing protein n=1 Tax=Desulfolutivibrio sulfodismutans TaxID=63561 RepID=A0A7K3NJT7_9BACT|nr:DUF190 domain-containing protein [Desulfolutivibrio sulfodismutans]NDY56471.1 DUF190 domain-containing protein [Desulfolutivibrio sulfodismutans]QLA12792.1 DUF190 domain-containing protein [Desulfolutivibrio sulfodismutans DSM 3696]